MKQGQKGVFKEIDNVKKHPIYKEAIRRFWRWFADTVAIIVLLTILLFGVFYYLMMSTPECEERCQAENHSDNCYEGCF